MRRAFGDAEREFALCHGLYWLICDLAESQPLLLIVDDLQHVDPPSLRFLLYLARRLQGLRIAIVGALRDGASESIARLSSESGVRAIRPRGLSVDGVARFVANRLGTTPDDEFVAACSEVTGGNPFLLEQLLRAAEDEGIQPVAPAATRMRELVPDAVTHSVVDRLRREEPTVKALARAIAILGDDVELRHAAQLADIQPAEAVACADRLVDLALLRPGAPLTFLHPLLRSTVLADLRHAGRVTLHAKAAAVLEADGAPIAAVAAHMIELEPAGDAHVVTVLREAARQALAGGAADIAARQLLRARREPPTLADRGAVLAELGYAASVAGDAATAAEALEASVLLATDPVERVERRLRAFRAHFQLDGRLDPDEILAIVADVDAVGEEPEATTQALVGDVVAAGTNVPSLLPELGVRLQRFASAPGDTVTERMMLAALSRVACFRGESAEHAAGLAERALTGGVAPEGAEAVSRFTALYTLIDADRLDAADEQLEATMAVSRWRGSLLGYASVVGCQALVAYQRGDITKAVADGATALQSGSLHGALIPIVTACLVRARLAAGDVAAAAELMAPLGDFAIPDIVVFNHALVARAQVRFALGDLDAALSDMQLALERVPRAVGCSRVLPWRAIAVPMLLAAGRDEHAARVAAEDVAGAKAWGTPGALGAALVAQARCAPNAERETILREAIALLEASPARLDLADARTLLGEPETGQRHRPGLAARAARRRAGRAGLRRPRDRRGPVHHDEGRRGRAQGALVPRYVGSAAASRCKRNVTTVAPKRSSSSCESSRRPGKRSPLTNDPLLDSSLTAQRSPSHSSTACSREIRLSQKIHRSAAASRPTVTRAVPGGSGKTCRLPASSRYAREAAAGPRVGTQSSDGACCRISASSRRRDGCGSMPTSSSSRRRHCWYAASASLCRALRYSASIRCAHSCSRSGSSSTSRCSSAMTDAC